MRKTIVKAVLAAGMFAICAPEADAQSWSLTGNAGTSGTNFVGTTDAKSLRFRTKNAERMRINHNGLVGIGNPSPKYRLDVKGKSNDSIYVVYARVNFKGDYDAIGINGVSLPAPGFGIGVRGLGNFVGVLGEGIYGVLGDGLAVGVQGQAVGADTTSFTGDLTGVIGYTDMGVASIGVYGEAENANFNYGVWGQASDTAGPDYALVGIGDVYAWRFFQASDRKLKRDIMPYTGALDRIMALSTSVYAFDQDQYPGMMLPTGTHIGFMADEVNKVFPELVKHGAIPAGAVRQEREGIKVNVIEDMMAVNYTGLIPVLAQAIKEQKTIVDQKDAEIAQLRSQIASIEARLAAMENTSSARLTSGSQGSALLEQNSPNPFNTATDIRYTVPTGYNNARIILTDTQGKVVRTYTLNGRGNGSVTIQAGELSAGTYIYSLVVDGAVVDSKNMLLTK